MVISDTAPAKARNNRRARTALRAGPLGSVDGLVLLLYNFISIYQILPSFSIPSSTSTGLINNQTDLSF